MDFLVKQINITNKTTSNLFEDHTHVDFPHLILLSTLVLVPLVNSIRNKSGNAKIDWSQLPLLARLNVYVIIATILLPALTILGGILLTYKAAVVVWLRCRHKEKFKGILSGPDSLWTLEDASPSVVNILLVVRHHSSAEFAQQALKKLQEIGDDPALWKLQCALSSCMSYTYLLMRERKRAPCVRRLDAAFYANREILQATLSELASVDIADGNLWETYVGAEAIAWGGKTHSYPLIVRFHHALGDGLALLQLVQRCFSPKADIKAELALNPTRREIKEHDSDNDFMQTMVKINIRLMHAMLMFYKLPEALLTLLSKDRDVNGLHHQSGMRAALTGEKLVAWKVENGYKYVNRVKSIKRRLAGAAFVDVIAASVGYSLNKFFKQRNEHVNAVNAVIPAIPHAANFIDMNANASGRKNCMLTNRFAVGVLKLPVNLTHAAHRSCYWRCAQTIANLYDLRKSFEFQLNYWLMNIIMGLVPRLLMAQLLRPSLGLSTLIISNLPGPRRVYLDAEAMEESFVEDIVFWVPQRGLTGVSLSIFTYDDRFQLGLAIDKVYGVTQREAEEMLESIFEYIDRLHEELGEHIYDTTR